MLSEYLWCIFNFQACRNLYCGHMIMPSDFGEEGLQEVVHCMRSFPGPGTGSTPHWEFIAVRCFLELFWEHALVPLQSLLHCCAKGSFKASFGPQHHTFQGIGGNWLYDHPEEYGCLKSQPRDTSQYRVDHKVISRLQTCKNSSPDQSMGESKGWLGNNSSSDNSVYRFESFPSSFFSKQCARPCASTSRYEYCTKPLGSSAYGRSVLFAALLQCFQ